MSWDDLRLLLAAARGGSFLAAGKNLGVATSTLSRGLTRLERSVGTRLVDRRSNGLNLTEAGRRLLEIAEEMELRLAARVRELPAKGGVLKGTVRVSAGDGFADFLAERAAEFVERHPAVSVELALESRTVDLARREADLAVRTHRGKEPTLVYQTLGRVPYGLYASTAYLRAHGAPRSPASFTRHRFVGFAPPLERIPVMGWLKRLGATRFSVRVTTFSALLAATRAGAGIAALPDRLAEGLELVLPRTRPEPLVVHLASHPDARAQPHMRAFEEVVRQRFRELTQ